MARPSAWVAFSESDRFESIISGCILFRIHPSWKLIIELMTSSCLENHSRDNLARAISTVTSGDLSPERYLPTDTHAAAPAPPPPRPRPRPRAAPSGRRRIVKPAMRHLKLSRLARVAVITQSGVIHCRAGPAASLT